MFDRIAGKLQSASLIVIIPALLLFAAFAAIGITTAQSGDYDHGAWMLILLYFGGGAVLLFALVGAAVYVIRSIKK